MVTLGFLLLGLLLVLAAILTARRPLLLRVVGTIAGSLGLLFVAASQVGVPVVFTNAQLRWLPAQSLYVVRLGVNYPFDAPPLWFKPSTTACGISGGDVGTQVPTRDGGCNVAIHPASGIDIRQFGASGSGSTTTASATSSSPNITLASASDFHDNQGVVLVGAGPAVTAGSPTAFGVASSCTGTSSPGDTVSGSPIVNNVAPIGLNVGDTITGAGIPGGTTVLTFNPSVRQLRMSANATATASAVSLSFADPCNVTYAYRIASYDNSGGITTPLAAQTTTVGPARLSTLNVNCLTWTRPATTTGLVGYVVWRSVAGGPYNFFQMAILEGSGSCTVLTNSPLWDGGQQPAVRPFWVPNDPATIPGGGQPGWLRTSIASGGGTTSLVLANNSQQMISSPTDPVIGTLLHDDTIAYMAWQNALNLLPATGVISSHHSLNDGQAVYRINGANQLTANNIRIIGEPGTVIKPFGNTASAFPIHFQGTPAGLFTPSGNFQEAQNCLPLTSISGLGVGDYLLVQQAGPGGSSQAGVYSMISPISALSCPDGITTGVRLRDSAGITFTDATHTETATITGTAGTSDTVTLTVSGDYTCTITYTVVSGDTLTYVARGLAQAVNSSGCGVGAVATHSLNVVTVQWGSATSITWGQSTTHPGGGTEAIALAAGTSYTVQKMSLVSNVLVDGVNQDGSDLTGTLFGSGWIGLYSYGTAKSTFKNLKFTNFLHNASSLTSLFGYGNTYQNVDIIRGAGGTPNIASFADFILFYDTNPTILRVSTEESNSFGPQLFAVQGAKVNDLNFNQAYYGRGFKVGSLLRSSLNNIHASNAVFNNMAMCCGSYRNQFNNLDFMYAYGENPEGLGTFDAWSRYNQFVNFRSAGSIYDIRLELTDYANTFVNVDLGTGAFSHHAGGFPSTQVYNLNSVFTNINGCEVAFSGNTTGSGLTCQRDSGSWTPAFAGGAAAGSVSYGIQQGSWERNDRGMTVRFNLATNGAFTGMAGLMTITGLPVAASGTGNGSCYLEVWKGVTLTAGNTYLSMGVAANDNKISIFQNGSGIAYSGTTVGSWANPAQVIGTCNYPVS